MVAAILREKPAVVFAPHVETSAGMVLPENQGKIALFAGIENARFRKPVVPGDTLRLEVTITAMKRGIGKADAKAFVGDTLACEAQLTFALVNRS